MEVIDDRDSKKPFVIPKTHTSNKDVLISEKPDSRNVMDLFNDIKSCALKAHFDFRPNDCKSCDTIRNQKLQKLYNEKRLKLKKEQEPVERLAFHLLVDRDVALSIATDGLACDQLPFSLEKYLGNPKDGVHLSKRPDVLLTSSGAQGLYRFGLLVCKILLGKGYATIPSTANSQLAAQLHYDHHFCKVQSLGKEQPQLEDLLANSLLYCYEHEDFQPVSHPSQILPIAVLWYDLKEKFPPELISSNSISTTIKTVSNQESPYRNGKAINGRGVGNKKLSNPMAKSISASSLLKMGTWEDPKQESAAVESLVLLSTPEKVTTTYPRQFMVPFHRPYSHPSRNKALTIDPSPSTATQTVSSRDPRLMKTKRETALISSETIPLSPQHLLLERAMSDQSFSGRFIRTSPEDSLTLTRGSSAAIPIPLNSILSLTDPRLATITSTRTIFFLELQAVKHALQQQKRLNQYHDSTTGLPPKTSYILIPYEKRQISADEYERSLNDDQISRQWKHSSHSSDYSSLHVSVVDCFSFGFSKNSTAARPFIDLEEDENRIAFDQMKTSSDLIERERQLNSQHRRLRLRERRHRRRQQQINQRRRGKFKSSSSSNSPLSASLVSPHSKITTASGRQMLKEYPLTSTLPNARLSSDLLEFFSREYRHETRPHVKHLLAELVGVFIDKYHLKQHSANSDGHQNGEDKQQAVGASGTAEDRSINAVIDMDIDSSPSQGLEDYDERFRSSPLRPLCLSAATEMISSSAATTSLLIPTSLNGTNGDLNHSTVTDPARPLVPLAEEPGVPNDEPLSATLLTAKIESIIPTNGSLFQACLDQLQSSSSSENTLADDDVQYGPSNNHLDTIEDYPIAVPIDSNQSRDEFVKLLTKEAFVSKSSSPAKMSQHQTQSSQLHPARRRSFEEDENQTSQRRSHRATEKTNGCTASPNTLNRSLSSTRTVTLVSNRALASNKHPSVPDTTDISPEYNEDEPSWKRAKLDSISPREDRGERHTSVTTTTDSHHYAQDLDERQTGAATASSTASIAESTSKDRRHADDHQRRRRRSSSHSHHSSANSLSNRSNHRSKDYSRPPSSSGANRSLPLNNRPRKSSPAQRESDRNRSADINHRYPLPYSTDFTARPSIFPESSYRSSLSSSYRSRPMDDLIVPGAEQRSSAAALVRHKRFNYNHQSVADHPRFANPETLASSASLSNFDYARSSTKHYRDTSPVTLRDRNLHSSLDPLNKIEPSKSTRHHSSQGFETKPSDTFEQLQLLLQTKSRESFDRPPHDHSRRTSSKSSSSLPRRADNVPSSSSTASDRTRQDKSSHSHTDPERLRN